MLDLGTRISVLVGRLVHQFPHRHINVVSTPSQFEILVRIVASGPSQFFFLDKEERAWNNFDFLLVVYATTDLLLTHALDLDKTNATDGGFALILRTARILRLLRIIRLIKFFRDLLLLVVGLANAIKLLAWVWFLLSIIIFVFGIVMTRVVGQPYGDSGRDPILDYGGAEFDQASDGQKIHECRRSPRRRPPSIGAGRPFFWGGTVGRKVQEVLLDECGAGTLTSSFLRS